MKEEREDGGERREKARERERAEGMGRRDQTVFTIYTWRFQREAEVRREKVDGRRDSELTY